MPTPNAQRGEVWIIDLGYLGKVRPCVVLSIPTQPHERTLLGYVPCTTQITGTRFEVDVKAKFLDPNSVVDAQQIGAVSKVKLMRRIGILTSDQLLLVAAAVKQWLGLAP